MIHLNTDSFPLTQDQEERISKLRKERQDNPYDEIDRLERDHFIDINERKILDGTIGNKYLIVIKMLCLQALAVKQILGNTHHVFFHAQETDWTIYTYLLKSLYKKKGIADLHQYKPLRPPRTTHSYLSSLGKQLLSRGWLDDHCSFIRERWISADSHLLHFYSGESVLYFLHSNFNVLSDARRQQIYKNTLQQFYPSLREEESSEYAEQLEKLIPKKSKFAQSVGNLFVICSPKNESADIQYRSHPNGTPCFCHPEKENRKVLESLQKGDLNDDILCWIEGKQMISQFRIDTHVLDPKKHRIYFFTQIPKKTRKKLKREVDSIVSRVEKIVENRGFYRSQLDKGLCLLKRWFCCGSRNQKSKCDRSFS